MRVRQNGLLYVRLLLVPTPPVLYALLQDFHPFARYAEPSKYILFRIERDLELAFPLRRRCILPATLKNRF